MALDIVTLGRIVDAERLVVQTETTHLPFSDLAPEILTELEHYSSYYATDRQLDRCNTASHLTRSARSENGGDCPSMFWPLATGIFYSTFT